MIERDQLIAIVCAVQNGEDNAATVLYETFYKDIYYFILKTVNDPELAQDLTQEAFIEILNTIQKLHEPAAFVNWSRQIAYHKCTAYFRKRKELLADENEDGYSVFDTLVEDREEFIPDEALDKEDLKQTIHAMINSLPEEQRAALIMRYFDEISVKDIAEVQGVSEGTVKSRLNYGRKAIKQSVEEYEKKHGIKLHCTGAIPLLLWLFREYRIANGISFTAKAASTAFSAVDTVSTATSATSNVAPVATEGLKVGAKAAGKFAAKKIVAGVVATTVIAGSVTAAVLSQNEETKAPMEWCGYGDVFYAHVDRRFEVTLDQIDDTQISGHLEVSYLYEAMHDTEFEGKGIESDGKVTYHVTFDTPLVSWLGGEFTEISMEYDRETDDIVFDDYYDVKLERLGTKDTVLIAKDEKWSGNGEDSLCNSRLPDHLFEMYVSEMSENAISGKMIVSKNGVMEHESEFTGRGFKKNGNICYEIKLETPRTVKNIITSTVDCFWLEYDCEKETLQTDGLYFYDVVMSKEK